MSPQVMKYENRRYFWQLIVAEVNSSNEILCVITVPYQYVGLDIKIILYILLNSAPWVAEILDIIRCADQDDEIHTLPSLLETTLEVNLRLTMNLSKYLGSIMKYCHDTLPESEICIHKKDGQLNIQISAYERRL